MNNDLQVVNDVIYNSPWRNAYWFARMLLNTDHMVLLEKRKIFSIHLLANWSLFLIVLHYQMTKNLLFGHETLLKEIRNSARPSTKAFGTALKFCNCFGQ